mmetsp:Transcript_16966/g.47368  ORF Transcript_16966/g.47368 Transcript_16966/m.47368 type:complete len:141 (+) Transcript_16966:570-992(+)
MTHDVPSPHGRCGDMPYCDPAFDAHARCCAVTSAADDSRPLEKWFYTNWLEKIDPETMFLLRKDGEDALAKGGSSLQPVSTRLGDTGGVQEGSDAEDSLEEVIRKGRKTPKFWSADNPVLVGTGLSIAGALLFGSLLGVN